MKDQKKDSARGFTLLELIVVLFLISIIVAVASVSMAPLMRSSRLEAAAGSISSTLRYAKALSSYEGRKQTVLFDLDSRGVGIEDRGLKNLPGDVNMEVIGPDNNVVESGVYKIIFYPSGAFEGGSVILWNGKKEIQIAPDPVTGVAETSDQEAVPQG